MKNKLTSWQQKDNKPGSCFESDLKMSSTKHPLPKAGTVEISPSILSADFARLANEIAEVESAGVRMLHLDIMDGHFVPNLSIGPVVVEKLRKHSNLCFDTHLMISNPEKYAEAFVKAGSDNITFHIETVNQPEVFIKYLRNLGVNCGVTLKPATSVETIEKVICLCDMVLVMTVEPGFGGQAFMEDAAEKCRRIREIAGDSIRIEVDGGINAATAKIAVEFGADTLVAGNAVFAKPDRSGQIQAILNSCREQ